MRMKRFRSQCLRSRTEIQGSFGARKNEIFRPGIQRRNVLGSRTGGVLDATWNSREEMNVMIYLIRGGGHNILINTGPPQDLRV